MQGRQCCVPLREAFHVGAWFDAVAYGPFERANGMRLPPMIATRMTAYYLLAGRLTSE